MIKNILITVLIFTSFLLSAQQASQPAMADKFREDGKIYIVIAVLAVIFVSLLVYLVMTERKLKKLEDELKNKK